MINDTSNLIIYCLLVTLGGVLGSFVTMLSYRLPKGLDLCFKPSACVNCKHRLGIKALIPVFSWLLAWGKCFYCRKPISKRYLLTELAMIALTLLNYYQFGLSEEFVFFTAVCVVLLTITVIDLENYIILDSLQLVLFVLLVGKLFFEKNYIALLNSLAISTLLPAVFWSLKVIFTKIKAKDALGWGDIKFVFIVGWGLNWQQVTIFLLASGILGTLHGLLWQKIYKRDTFPFVPSLAVGLLICLYLKYTP